MRNFKERRVAWHVTSARPSRHSTTQALDRLGFVRHRASLYHQSHSTRVALLYGGREGIGRAGEAEDVGVSQLI
jgi:hypothetical protein